MLAGWRKPTQKPSSATMATRPAARLGLKRSGAPTRRSNGSQSVRDRHAKWKSLVCRAAECTPTSVIVSLLLLSTVITAFPWLLS